MRVIVSHEASEDLERIGDFIAQDNPNRARSFIAELVESCRDIGRKPEAFPLVPRHQTRGVRRRVHGAYLIFYRTDAETVTVLHILHGARDYEALLFPDED